MKKVLIIATHFPPLGGISPLRISSFVRHLPEFGWEPLVLTPSSCAFRPGALDRDAGDELEQYVVHRCEVPKWRRTGRCGVRRLLLTTRLLRDPRAALGELICRMRYREDMRGDWFFYRAAKKFLCESGLLDDCDLILATSPALDAQWIAHWASAVSGLPWVADCRDDYGAFKRKIPAYAGFEKALLKTASLVTTVSRGLQEEIGARTGQRVEVVFNGFEEELLEDRGPTTHLDGDLFNIVYTGRVVMFSERRPDLLVKGLVTLRERDAAAADKVRVSFFGDSRIGELFDKYARKFPGVERHLHDGGSMTRREVISVQQSADVLLLLAHAGQKGVLTGKVFEYLASGRPILCLPGDGGELDALVTDCDAGCSLGAADAVADYLEKAVEDWENGASNGQRRVPGEKQLQFSRQKQVRRLAELLNEVANKQTSATEIRS